MKTMNGFALSAYKDGNLSSENSSPGRLSLAHPQRPAAARDRYKVPGIDHSKGANSLHYRVSPKKTIHCLISCNVNL